MKIIKSWIFPGVLMVLLLLSCNNKEAYHIDKNELRAPAYPLVTILTLVFGPLGIICMILL